MKTGSDNVVAIFGQGYVGLPLALAACSKGFKVIGFDTDREKIDKINVGISPLTDLISSEIKSAISNQVYLPTHELHKCKQAEIKIICVPTPLNSSNKPDLEPLNRALISLSEVANEGDLIIIESTIAPGMTRNFILTRLKNILGDKFTFDLAYSPERIDPGNNIWTIYKTPKLVSGLNEKSTLRAESFYRKIIDNIILCGSVEIAEMSKLLENTFRLVNISFINELTTLCVEMNIDINEVIDAASSKPYGFLPFRPSFGAGGHCIPVDPVYLTEFAMSKGIALRTVELAKEVNSDQVNFYIDLVNKKLGSLFAKRILVIGLAYKPNLSDVRETPVKKLIESLRNSGADVKWHDELVKSWEGEESTPITLNFDLAIVATKHDYINLTSLQGLQILTANGLFG